MAFTPFTENDAPTMAAFNEKFEQIDAAVADAIANGTKIKIGSYKGAGTAGSANPNSLSFDFEPKLVIVVYGDATNNSEHDYYQLIMVRGAAKAQYRMSEGMSFSNVPNTLTWGERSVSWAFTNSGSSYAAWQFNASGKQYNYIAFG